VFAEFRYLDGPVAGTTRIAAADFATIGRHPGSDVPFDPEHDLVVSVRHAAVFKQGGCFHVRDLGSTNGTLVNGVKVRGDRPLEAGDVLQLGPTGPRLEFRIVGAMPRPGAAFDPVPARAEPARRRVRTTDRLQAARRETSRWKWLAALAVVLAAVAGGQAVRQMHAHRAAVDSARAALLLRVDALLTRLEQTSSGRAGITAALVQARARTDTLRQAIATTRRADRLDTLASALVSQAERHDGLMQAARLDAEQIARDTERAVAVVVAELPGGTVQSGSGFAIRARGDSVWLVTARHLVRDSAGRAARRLAVIFNGTGQAFRATLARVHDTADVALLSLRIRGGAPVITALRDSVRPGDPVAMLGFPGGLDSLGNWRVEGTEARASVGTVAELGPTLLAVDGYGMPGSSGGPVVAPTGEVVGVVSGGDRAGAVPLVVAVRGRLVRELLAADGATRER
jgi:S1-C subfamily serine protease